MKKKTCAKPNTFLRNKKNSKNVVQNRYRLAVL